MEPVTSIVGAIFKVLQEIAKAGRTARRNRTRCRELARRAEAVGDVLRDFKAAGARGAAAATRRSILCRLKEALDDALELVESCHRSDSLLSRLLAAGARAARFDDVDKRITNCLVDLSAASGACVEKKINQLAASDHHRPRTNKSVHKDFNAGNAPKTEAMAARNGNNGGGWKKGGQNGGKGGKRRRGKKARAAAVTSPPPPPLLAHAGVPWCPDGHGYVVHHHFNEEDPTSCSVM